MKFSPGDSVFVIENHGNVTKVKIKSCKGGFYTVLKQGNIPGSVQAIRLRENRIFATREEAKSSIPPKSDINFRWHPH